METDLNVLYDFILDYSNDGFFDWPLGTNPNYEYLSPRFKEILGYADHEMENKPSSWQDLVFPEDMQKLQVSLEEHFKTGNPFAEVLRYHHRDGHTIWVLCRVMALKDENGAPIRIMGTHTDVTELKQMENRLREINEARQKFMAVMSHEMRTPLNGIIGMTQVLSDKMETGEENSIILCL